MAPSQPMAHHDGDQNRQRHGEGAQAAQQTAMQALLSDYPRLLETADWSCPSYGDPSDWNIPLVAEGTCHWPCSPAFLPWEEEEVVLKLLLLQLLQLLADRFLPFDPISWHQQDSFEYGATFSALKTALTAAYLGEALEKGQMQTSSYGSSA